MAKQPNILKNSLTLCPSSIPGVRLGTALSQQAPTIDLFDLKSHHQYSALYRLSANCNRLFEIICTMCSNLHPESIMCLADGDGGLSGLLGHVFPSASIYFSTLKERHPPANIGDQAEYHLPLAYVSEPCPLQLPSMCLHETSNLFDIEYINYLTHVIQDRKPGLITVDLLLIRLITYRCCNICVIA